jgi:hypothetical protein
MKTTCVLSALLALAACTSRTESTAGGEDSGVGRSAPPAPGAPREKPSEPPAALTESVEYYDGEEQRTAWISPDLVAEFAPSDAGRAAVLAADADAAEVEIAQKDVRVWRVRAPQGTPELARVASAGSVRLSPVLHDAPVAGRPLRALPGGVIATFPPEWDRARIDAWLAARNLRVESQVIEGASVYLVATPPGLAAIRVANSLHESGEIVSATPDFWMQVSAR